MEKLVIAQKLVLKITQICVAATQIFPTQARFQHKSDFEHKNFVCAKTSTFFVETYPFSTNFGKN
jgi:hypothetical protein